MCGIIGARLERDVATELVTALAVLQHRGQDGAGIAVSNHSNLHVKKGAGMVRDVFVEERDVAALSGNIGIGHVRYPTWGSLTAAEAQPLSVNVPYGLSLVHNGQLVNAEDLRHWLRTDCRRYLTTGSDSEILLNAFAHYLFEAGSGALVAERIFACLEKTMERCPGAYAVAGLILGGGLVAFRDPLGIRPLILGSRKGKQGRYEYMVASESCVLSVLGYTGQRDLRPGEMIFIDEKTGALKSQISRCATNEKRHCIFELIYLARPDSCIDSISVYQARCNLGDKLAKAVQREWHGVDIDAIVPVPECSNTAAAQCARVLGVPYREGFVKNRYSGRTFIVPESAVRHREIRRKYNPIRQEFEGKSVLLVDDSIVRGSTARRLVQLVRDQGASQVYIGVAAPPVRFPNLFGIDVPTRRELIAHGRSNNLICEDIGADKLIYISVEDMVSAVRACSHDKHVDFDLSMFDGKYHFTQIDEAALRHHESMRADGAMQPRPTARPKRKVLNSLLD